jgi:hypothetical protein
MLSRAWYDASIADFLAADPDAIIGRLTQASNVAVEGTQTTAWREQIALLKPALAGLSGLVLFEFNIPRMGRRIDVVLLIGSVIFVVEYKVGESAFERAAVDQVWDYALDLKNFHEGSHNVAVVPILVATDATDAPALAPQFSTDGVCRPLQTTSARLRETIDQLLLRVQGGVLNEALWLDAPYRPTPTIVEAARALYAQHSVEAIARHDAGAKNLHTTTVRIEELVDQAKTQGQKIICFVTGVPGAGKTLVGLNVATQRRERDQPTHAVFLSGNGPLVAVLREALTRDELTRRKRLGEKTQKSRVANPVKAFIQNVHHFRDEALRDRKPPVDHVVIFDEAQRAWNAKKTASFMRQKKGQPDFSHSEPAFLISYLDRHPDWAVIICLVGGGQEIHSGEAGISEWLESASEHFPHWRLYISSQLTDSEYAAGKAMTLLKGKPNIHYEDDLHLAVSMRSFRADNVSSFVKSMLDCEAQQAQHAFGQLSQRFPMALTRDLSLAKQWIRDHARGTERYGLVASSKAMRLKPHAIDIRVAVDPIPWFLNDREDTRSSFYLEDCATEFQVQGLELDWICVSWDGDLRHTGSGWSYHDFRGKKWQNVKNEENRAYLKNAYRVLLTRARQGMVVFIPPGASNDHTRLPSFYDSTFNYLSKLGIPVLG